MCAYLLSNYSAVAGIYTVTCFTARNMDSFKYEFCTIKTRQCSILGVVETPRRARGTPSQHGLGHHYNAECCHSIMLYVVINIAVLVKKKDLLANQSHFMTSQNIVRSLL